LASCFFPTLLFFFFSATHCRHRFIFRHFLTRIAFFTLSIADTQMNKLFFISLIAITALSMVALPVDAKFDTTRSRPTRPSAAPTGLPDPADPDIGRPSDVPPTNSRKPSALPKDSPNSERPSPTHPARPEHPTHPTSASSDDDEETGTSASSEGTATDAAVDSSSPSSVVTASSSPDSATSATTADDEDTATSSSDSGVRPTFAKPKSSSFPLSNPKAKSFGRRYRAPNAARRA
jgi:hypothetical protein